MNRALPLLAITRPVPWPDLITELQTLGLRWIDAAGPGLSRAGGAGPSDHKAVTLGDQTVMVPIFTHAAAQSPFSAEVAPNGHSAVLRRDGSPVGGAYANHPTTREIADRQTKRQGRRKKHQHSHRGRILECAQKRR